ncbi:MAG TPA: FtsX-like permease family protein [Acidimicrobiales bacterium]|nr:FtsX-like permease family protein [Acidimicrobiales bacterium]
MSPRALGRLVRAELRGRRLGAMLLFVLVVALASATMVAGLEGQTRAGARWDAAFQEANGAHVAVFGDAETLQEVAGDPRVGEASRPYRMTSTERQVRRNSADAGPVLIREVTAEDLPSIGRPLLRDGRWGAGADEVVIDRAFGIEEGIGVGDTIAVDGPAGSLPFTVTGRAVDLVDCLYPNCQPAPAWLAPAAFARVAGGDVTEVLHLRLHDPGQTNAFVADLARRDVAMLDWIDTRDDALGATALFSTFLQAFGLFVIVAAAVVVAGSMATRAIARRRDIGLLKAIGFTPVQVGAALVLSHAAAAAAGVLLGWLLGGLLATRLQLQIGRVLGGGDASFPPLASLLVAFVAVEVIVAVAVVIPAWRAGRQSTTAALAPVPPGGRHRSILAVGAQLLGLGPVSASGLRDAFARPARSVLTAVALAVAVVAVLVSMAVNRTVDRVLARPALAGDPEEIRLYPRDSDPAAVTQALATTSGVESWFTETPENLVLGDERFLGVAMSGDLAAAGYLVQQGRMPAGPGEAAAGYGLLQRFGLAVGDEVTVEAGASSLTLRVVGWYREAEDTGEVLRFTLDDLRRVRPDAAVAWVGVNTASGDARMVASALAAAVPGATVVPLETRASDEVQTFRLAFTLVSALVIAVALANLVSTMLLAVRERVHDLGVLRAVGVTPSQVLAIVAIGAGVLGATAAALGMPLAWAATRAVTEVVGEATGIGPGIGVGPSPVVLALVVPAGVAVAAAIGAVAARRAASAPISELVRYE